MKSKMKPNARRVKAEKTSNTPSVEFRLKGSEWLVLPLSLLALACTYTFLSTLPNGNYFNISSPTVTSVLVGVFAAIYIYKALRRAPRHPFATVVASIFSVVFIILVGVLIATSGNECGGDCNTSSALVAWLVVFNPFVAMLWSPLAIGGIVTMLVKLKK